jgi:hypothetical protein
MRYVKTYKDRQDAEKLAQMLAVQEANQTLRKKMETMQQPQSSGGSPLDPTKLLEMMNMFGAQRNNQIGRQTFHTTNPYNTQGLA